MKQGLGISYGQSYYELRISDSGIASSGVLVEVELEGTASDSGNRRIVVGYAAQRVEARRGPHRRVFVDGVTRRRAGQLCSDGWTAGQSRRDPEPQGARRTGPQGGRTAGAVASGRHFS